MVHNGRQDEDVRPRGEFNNLVNIKQDKMTPFLVIIWTHGCDMTPAGSLVCKVEMVITDRLWAKIYCCSWIDAIVEVPNETRIKVDKLAQFVGILLIKLRGVICQGA